MGTGTRRGREGGREGEREGEREGGGREGEGLSSDPLQAIYMHHQRQLPPQTDMQQNVHAIM